MDELEQLQLLHSSPQSHFNVFQAYNSRLGKSVILQSFEFSTPDKCELFLKHHLKLARSKEFVAPLIAIFPHVEEDTQSTTLNFMWEKVGDALDPEIIADCRSQDFTGKYDYAQKTTVSRNPHTEVQVREAFSETLGEVVILKVFTANDLSGLSKGLSEALAHARCLHPSICSYLDVCFFLTKNQRLRLYLVMEKLGNDLEKEILSRKQPLAEEEMWPILLDVCEGLLCLKAHVRCMQDITYPNIKPSNIMRSKSGQYKISGFSSALHKNIDSLFEEVRRLLISMNFKPLDTTPQPHFLFDIYTFGVMMLRLASMKLPPPSRIETEKQLRTLIRQEVDSLLFSEDLKDVLVQMMEIIPQSRLSLEDFHSILVRKMEAQCPVHILQAITEEANTLKQAKLQEAAIVKYTHAHQLYMMQFPTYLETADNLHAWGRLLMDMDRNEEAVAKYAEADTIYSAYFPTHLNTGVNLRRWGLANKNMEDRERAGEKFEAADTLLQRYYPTDLQTAHNLFNWSLLYNQIKEFEKAGEKHARADAIYSILPEHLLYKADNLSCWGQLYKSMGRYSQAHEKYSEAHTILSLHFPLLKTTAGNLANWAKLFQEMEDIPKATEKFIAATTIHMQRNPHHIDTAMHLKDWADFFKDTNQHELAMQKYKEAHAIYSQFYPTHHGMASCLGNWGLLYSNMGQFDEALEKIIEADAIFTRLYPTAKNTAVNRIMWADSLLALGSLPAALEIYRTAETLLCKLAVTDSDGPIYLSVMGDSFEEAGETELALEFIEKALALFEQYHPNIIDYANSLASIAIIFDNMDDKDKAEDKYAAADVHYRRFPKCENAARNLWNWGIMLGNLLRETEAIPKIQQALTIYEQVNENDSVVACEQLIEQMEANLRGRASN